MYVKKIEELKQQMSDMISAAREEGRSLNSEELEKAASMKAEIDALRSALEVENLVDDWKAAEKAEIRAARKIEAPEAAEGGNLDEEKRAFVDYVKRGQNETGIYGGYTVPTVLYNWIVDKRDAESYMRRLATVINIDSSGVKIPVEGSDIATYWVAEGGNYTEGTQQLTQASLDLYKLTCMATVTEELAADSALNFADWLITKIIRQMTAAEETAFVKGSTLNNEPSGLITGIEPVRTASATAVTVAEIQDLFYGLAPQYQRNASWLISGGLAAKLCALTTGTGGIFAWGNLETGAPATLMGKPCYISKDFDAVVANKVIACVGDIGYYYIADGGSLSIQRLNELFAASGKIGIKATARVGGILTNSDAVKVLGTKTS